MHYYKVLLPLLMASLVSACTSSGYRDMNVSDDSEIFNNIEISKDISDRIRIQFESSITKTTGSSVSYASNSHYVAETPVLISDNIYAYFRLPDFDMISVGDTEYLASKVSYNYSVAHKTISGSYDFIHGKHFGLRLALGASQYDYSVTATMHGNVDTYKYVTSETPITVNYGTSSIVSNQYWNYKTPQGQVNNKKLKFDFTDYGIYVGIEPHAQFNKHYGASIRLATSIGEDIRIGTNINTEVSLRLNYTPVEALEIYTGYQYFSLGKDLDKDENTPSHGGHGESNLTIDTRGLLMGLALRF